MEMIEPRVFHLAETKVDSEGLLRFLAEQGAGEWETDAGDSHASLLTEVAGRACYRSWAPGLNPNVKKVRQGNTAYLGNILKQHHGSVLEHATVTYAITGVSRVFTHEVVRHRLCAFSQESLRFVRLDKLKAWFPDAFRHHKQSEWLEQLFRTTFNTLESTQRILARKLELDSNLGFAEKKILTSAMRRLAPIGLATLIVVTTNHRNWRHLITMRTAEHAEEEIRWVFSMLFRDLEVRHPNLYQDAIEEPGPRDIPVIRFENEKV